MSLISKGGGARRVGWLWDGVAPEQVVWSVEEAGDLFAEAGGEAVQAGVFTVPRTLVDLAETAIQARDPERFALLYGLIWRAHRGEKKILEDAADPLVSRVNAAGAGGASRHAQDAGVRALSRGERGRGRSLRRLVRA